MSDKDNTTTAETAPTPRPKARRGMKAALIASLTVNFLILGMVAGAILKDGPRHGFRPGAEVGFGPFTEALSDDDRRALRKSFDERMPGFGDMRQQARADFAALIAALRAPEWDEAKVRALLDTQTKRTAERIALGQDLMLARIAQMTPDERAAFADRIEKSIRRFGGRD